MAKKKVGGGEPIRLSEAIATLVDCKVEFDALRKKEADLTLDEVYRLKSFADSILYWEKLVKDMQTSREKRKA